jgi:hypothetical protein
MPHSRVLGIAGLIVWLMVGLPVVIQGATSAPHHVSSILIKLGARDRTRAVLKALESGLL